MIALLWLFLALLASPFKSKSRLDAENAALRYQLIVLKRRVRGRVQLTNGDRLFLVQLYRWFPSVLKAITVVRPETLVRWHRAGFRRYWRWKSRSLGGRPKIAADQHSPHQPLGQRLGVLPACPTPPAIDFACDNHRAGAYQQPALRFPRCRSDPIYAPCPRRVMHISVTPNKWDAAEMPPLHGFDEEFGQDATLSLFRRGGPIRKPPAQIVTNKRSPVVHVSTEVPRPLGEAFEDIARANGITKAELLRRLIQALVEKTRR